MNCINAFCGYSRKFETQEEMIKRIEDSIMNTGEKVKEGSPGELLSRQMSDGE